MILGQLLIFALLIGVEVRVFIVKQAKKDSLVFIAPITLLLSVLITLAWGLSVVNIIALSLSTFVTILNIYSLVKFASGLLTDSYSSFTKVLAIFSMLLCTAAIIFAIIFCPVTRKSSKIGTTELKEYYEGNFRTGFTPINAGSKTNAIFYQYSTMPDLPRRTTAVILVTDKRGDAEAYTTFMQYLSKEGYTVCSMDFYTDDMYWFNSGKDSRPLRKFSMITSSLFNNSMLEELKETFSNNCYIECNAIVNFLDNRYGNHCKYFLIGDGMSGEAVTKYAKDNPEKILGSFVLDTISEYKTPGFGCVEETNPLVAKFLGQKRDKDGFITKYLVLKTSAEIRKALGLKPKVPKREKE